MGDGQRAIGRRTMGDARWGVREARWVIGQGQRAVGGRRWEKDDGRIPQASRSGNLSDKN